MHDPWDLITTVALFTALQMCAAVRCNASTSAPSPTRAFPTHVRAAAVHLQRADGRDQDHDVGLQAGGAALDVEELLHPNVGPEPGFGH